MAIDLFNPSVRVLLSCAATASKILDQVKYGWTGDLALGGQVMSGSPWPGAKHLAVASWLLHLTYDTGNYYIMRS